MSDTEGGQYHEQAAASLASSVAGISAEAEERRVVQFLIDAEIPENHEVNAVKGAFLAKGCGWNTNPDAHPTNTVDPLVSVSRRDKSVLDREDGKLSWSNFISNLRDYPSKTYWLLFLCSIGALVQGFDEAAVNGAQVFYVRAFPDALEGDKFKLGLVNAAPYLVSAASCLLNPALNRLLRGRRGVIWVTCAISSMACLGQALPRSWEELLALRLLMGLGIGPKRRASFPATIPVYASECMPAKLRGGLVMMWQMWTAFGIMLGLAFGVAFWDVVGLKNGWCSDYGCSWNWRLMLAIPMIPALIPVLFVFTLPESPRYLLQQAINAGRAAGKDQHDGKDSTRNTQRRNRLIGKAYKALASLNCLDVQAWRELFRIYDSLNENEETNDASAWYPEIHRMWKENRARNGLLASAAVMFMQQLCGINVMVYYYTSFLDEQMNGTDETTKDPYLISLGFGAVNFFFAFPALYLMDIVGRRFLLLTTFPLMALCMFITAILLIDIDEKKKAAEGVLAGIVTVTYIFCAVYSVGEGPVPFVYSSESMPQKYRDSGMGIVTFVTWIFNFTLAITWPTFEKEFGLSLSFVWYGVWCVIGFFLVLIFVRETKRETLEDLDVIFEPSIMHYIRFALTEADYFWGKSILRSRARDRPNWKEEAKKIVARQNGRVGQHMELQQVRPHNSAASEAAPSTASGAPLSAASETPAPAETFQMGAPSSGSSMPGVPEDIPSGRRRSSI